MKFCPDCGKPCEGLKFCGECGFDLRPYIPVVNNITPPEQPKPQATATATVGVAQPAQPAKPQMVTAQKQEQTIPDNIEDLLKPFVWKLNDDGKTFTITGVKDTNIQSADIPYGVTCIGERAFYRCKFTSVTIPNSVTNIRSYAFSYCNSLTNITIPSGVTSIGESAFDGCRSLSNIEVDPSNHTYHSAGNCIIETATQKLIVGFNSSIIPSDKTVTEISCRAFSGCQELTSINIPNNITCIGNSAFSYCNSLTNITIPRGVTSIGKDAFRACESLTSVTISNSVTSIGVEAFAYCDSLTRIEVDPSNPTYHSASNCIIETATKKLIIGCKSSIIPSDRTVTEISYRAFSGCRELTSINIPNNIVCIGHMAFYDCRSLTNVTIPSSVTIISDNTFQHCFSLTNLTIPSSVTIIGNFAFYNCYSLTSITIPNSVTRIGREAFYNCSLLKKAYVPRRTEIAQNAFPPTCQIIRT